ncbi:MAG: adenylosuccinate synthetase [Nitrospirota bacterium]
MGAFIIVDAFWGDAGKGKFCAFLSKSFNAKLAVRAGTGTNSGHSIFIGDKFIKCKMLPLGWINEGTKVLISSGVAVDPEIFLNEIREYNLNGRAFVDWRCPIIEKKHIEFEQTDEILNFIDSTKSGSGKARADFIMRKGKQAKDIVELSDYLIDSIIEINDCATTSTVVIEGSQATFLSLYASDRYPYVTSDNCTTAAFLDDASLNWQLIEKVILLVKCLPTCVGKGYLPHEMTKEEIISRNLDEYGVNTGRFKRRSSCIDWERLSYSVKVNGPTEIALTYCDQFDPKIENVKERDKITYPIWKLIEKLEDVTQVPVRYLETGKDFSNIIIL